MVSEIMMLQNSPMLAFFFGDEYSPFEIIRRYGWIFPVAFIVSLLATPICRKVALRLKVVDYPDDDVKTHAAPTAYLGGVGMMLGLMAGLLVGFFLLFLHWGKNPDPTQPSIMGFTGHYPDWLILAGIGFGAALACGVGVLDDLLDIRPLQKIIGQVIAAAVLVGVGVRPNLVQLFGFINIQIDPMWNFILGVPVVLFFIVGATNSLNLLDGLDGLCAGVTAIITTAFMLLALSLATWGHSPVGDPVRLILCLAMMGAALGFLPMNSHPARIFMGDAGSMLLGFVGGTLMLLFAERVGRWTIASIIIFGLPILDTAVALVRRLLNKRSPFKSDRSHIYDQLMDRGISLKKTVAICYILAGVYALIGLVVSKMRFRYSVLVFGIVFIFSALFVWWGGFLTMPPETKLRRDKGAKAQRHKGKESSQEPES
jgi:UDP-GlcNAc:undecaprenyl-phosphate GlcNAc-1-phosphate transferase